MVPLQSVINQKIYSLYYLEQQLKPEGFVIGSNWDYDKGFFDLKIDDQDTYYYLRIPFHAVAGALDYPGVSVQMGEPFLLAHQYQLGNDVKGHDTGLIQGAFNQFQAPENPDAEVPDEYVKIGKEILDHVESILAPS